MNLEDCGFSGMKYFINIALISTILTILLHCNKKYGYLLPMSKKLIFLFLLGIHWSVAQTLNTKTSHDKQEVIKKMVVGTFVTTIGVETLLWLSKSFQSLIFGGAKVSCSLQDSIAKIANTIGLQTPATQQAYSGWHWLLGPLFSNHQTLFIDPRFCSRLHNDQEALQKLQNCLVNIQYKRDRSILIAAVAIPLIMYGILKGSSVLLEKVQENSFLGALKKGMNFISRDFKTASLITLGTLFGFIKAQDYFLANQAMSIK